MDLQLDRQLFHLSQPISKADFFFPPRVLFHLGDASGG